MGWDPPEGSGTTEDGDRVLETWVGAVGGTDVSPVTPTICTNVTTGSG